MERGEQHIIEQAPDEEDVQFVNECLRGSYDDMGVARWWTRPRAQLDGLTPQQAWVTDREKVIALAVMVTL